MRKFNFVALFLVSVGFSTTVQAHAMLDHATPPVGGTVGSSPGQVALYFTQQLDRNSVVRKYGMRLERAWTRARASAAM
jgi:methionine-rich copper-binding protein CopC